MPETRGARGRGEQRKLDTIELGGSSAPHSLGGAEACAVKRPLVLRLLPDRLCLAAFARLFRPVNERWYPLYRDAPLRFAPNVTMDLAAGDVISDYIAFTGLYELKLSRHLLRLARTGGTMIDVGAHLGYFSLLWVAANRANNCLSFEPSPRNIERLKGNVARNGFGALIEVLPQAAGREHASLPFDVGPPGQTGWGGIAATPGVGTILVEAVRVDEVVSNANEVALLKIDAEGADAWVLMGCERLLRRRQVKSVWFEQNRPRMRALGIGEGEAGDYLRSLGYFPSPLSNPSAETVQWSATPV